MRKLACAAAAFTFAVGILLPSPARAADDAVLTEGSLGGTAVPVGAVITSTLKTGTNATFYTTADGTTGVTCAASSFSGTVVTNPSAGGVATESVTAQTFSSCTSNIFGVTGVQSITVGNLPFDAAVDGTAGTITVASGAAGAIQATVKLRTLLGSTTCVYRVVGTGFSGVTSNSDNSIAFSGAEFAKFSGSVLCPSSSFFTATYAPAVDSSAPDSPAVFVQ
jgi:hypothetical protein